MPQPAWSGGLNPVWGGGWEDVRALWDLDPAVRHLNHGSYGAVPREVRHEQGRWRAEADANPNAFHSRLLPSLMQGVRRQVAAFVGADAGCCVLVPNVTAGIATVLASVPLRAGDEVLVLDDGYVGVHAAVRAACARAGARMRTVALPPDAAAAAAAVEEACGAAVRLAVVDHVTSPTARLLPVADMVRRLQRRGVLVAVDGAHAAGATNLDVTAVGADFYLGNLHKWCCAPQGAGFLVVAPSMVDQARAGVVGSRAAEGFPAGLEWWGTSDYTSLLAVPAALALLSRLDPRRVRQHNADLVDVGARTVVAALGADVEPQPAVLPMQAVPLRRRMSAAQADGLRTLLGEAGFETAVVSVAGEGVLRLSAQVYNQPADYEALAAVLPAVLSGLPRV